MDDHSSLFQFSHPLIGKGMQRHFCDLILRSDVQDKSHQQAIIVIKKKPHNKAGNKKQADAV